MSENGAHDFNSAGRPLRSKIAIEIDQEFSIVDGVLEVVDDERTTDVVSISAS